MNPPQQMGVHPTFFTSEWGTRILIGIFVVWVIQTIVIGIFGEKRPEPRPRKK